MRRFIEKLAVRTSGAVASGRRFPRRLADEGALVVVTDANAVTAVEVAATVEAGGCDCFQLEAYTRNQANSLICSGYLWRSHQ
ncbi:hypothetical protein GFPCMMHI_03727 [Ensifer adhaerens]|jgi:hypothetical protein|nr:hypothetical protein [Ensifer adhaerens]